MPTINVIAPTLADFEELARQALEQIPTRMRVKMENVAIRIEEFPDAEVVAEMELESPFDILGLYRGVSLDRKSYFDAATEPDMVFLYRRRSLIIGVKEPIRSTRWCAHVLIHEIGHHFGFSDDDMAAIERKWWRVRRGIAGHGDNRGPV